MLRDACCHTNCSITCDLSLLYVYVNTMLSLSLSLPLSLSLSVVSLAEIITNVDEVDFIMFNSISNPIQKSNKNNLDVVQLAAMVKVICNSMTYSLYTTDIYK